ncbi:aminoacyl-tRNA hydrolase [Elusimicrobiota bacterium]
MNSSRLFLIGLGNPGDEYKNTRHNLGFMILDLIADDYKIRAGKPYMVSETKSIIAVKPSTFMNRSGIAVLAVIDDYGISPEDILVVCDDFNLPLGKLRLRRGGSAGGHNGLQSIMDKLQENGFPRLRLGMGNTVSPDKSGYVLEEFSRSENGEVEEMLQEGKNLIEYYIKNGIRAAMDRYN